MTKFSRRTFVKSIGAGLGLLPLLEADGLAADGAPRKRLLIVVQPNGMFDGFYGDDVKPEYLPRTASGDLATAEFPYITKDLERHKKNLSVLRLDLSNVMEHAVVHKSGGHEAYGGVFSGGPGKPQFEFHPLGPTIDQVIGDAITKRAPELRRSLPLAAATDYSSRSLDSKRAFFRGENQPVTPEHDPYKAADALFGGGTGEDPRLVRLRAERKTILDAVGPDLKRYMRNLGTADKQRVDGHLQAVQDLQRQLAAAAVPRAAACTAPKGAPIDVMANDNLPSVIDLHFQVAKLAFACDLTRVATVQIADARGEQVMFNWLGIDPKGIDPLNPNGPRQWHDIAHVAIRDGKNDKANVDKWLMGKFAKLVDDFVATPEGTGTLLDGAAIVWANHMNDGGAHGLWGVPFFVAGSCGGYLRTGRVLDARGQAVNGLLVALGNAMDCPAAFFGDKSYGGELAGLRRT